MAARATYTTDPDDPWGPPRDVYGFCPMGIVLMADGLVDTIMHGAPASVDVAGAVFDVEEGVDYDAVDRQARQFIHDFDNHLFRDVYEALGVERVQP